MEDLESKPLTESQKVFCNEWILDFNGTRSYKVAYPGSSDEAARSSASDLLTKPNIKAYCKELQDNLAEIAGISKLKVLKEVQKIAFSSIASLHNEWISLKEFESLTEDQKACISEIQTQKRVEVKFVGDEEVPWEVDYVKIKLHDKLKGIDMINKMLGFNTEEKIQISTPIKRFLIVPADGQAS